MSKLELKRVLDELEIKKPMRLMQRNLHFQVPDAVAVEPINKPTGELIATEPVPALSQSRSLNLKETGSKMDRVENGPRPKQTGSEIDSVQNEPGSKETGSKKDPVTLVKNYLPLIFHTGVLKPRSHFTAIPNTLLRDANAFANPNDFMIYLRMFSLAFGFGRNTCDMGMAELLAFTRLGKNAIRRSLERLINQGWIKKLSDSEAGQVPRKWRIFAPCEMGLTHEPTYYAQPTGSKIDPVQNGPGLKGIQTGSKTDPVTGSKMDPYKDREERKVKESSLSELSDSLRIYFSDLKPQRKKESEQRAFEEIRKDFSIIEITKCFDYLKRKGLPGGDPCHSPMAYLATAMRGVLEIVESQESLEKTRAESKARQEADERSRAEQSACEEREWKIKEYAFNKTYSGEDRQTEVIAEICRNKHFPLRGAASRAFAINAWFSGLTVYEKKEVME